MIVPSYDNKLVKSFEFNLFLIQLLNMNFTIIKIIVYLVTLKFCGPGGLRSVF